MKQLLKRLLVSIAAGTALVCVALGLLYFRARLDVIEHRAEAERYADDLIAELADGWDPRAVLDRMSLERRLTVDPETLRRFVETGAQLGPITHSSRPRVISGRTTLSRDGFVFTAVARPIADIGEEVFAIDVTLVHRRGAFELVGVGMAPLEEDR